ncbi:hypothetical protein [Facilibium subflavum]|uniref:hypothetical protein n=1 Tax=Facilibium subflavum TaxID=2219058 RepID=UPI0013C2C428|nr:hypothetical protein [Facilibium subflavum]
MITKKPDNFLYCENGPFVLSHVELPAVAAIEGYQDNITGAQCKVYPDKNGNFQLVITRGSLLHPESTSILNVKTLPKYLTSYHDGNLSVIRWNQG